MKRGSFHTVRKTIMMSEVDGGIETGPLTHLGPPGGLQEEVTSFYGELYR